MRIMIMMIALVFFVTIATVAASPPVFSIAQFGAIADDASATAAERNSAALRLALLKANATAGPAEVLVPQGHWFEVFHVAADHLRDVTLRVDGELRASRLRSHYLWYGICVFCFSSGETTSPTIVCDFFIVPQYTQAGVEQNWRRL